MKGASALILDDHLLLRVLLDDPPRVLRRSSARLYVTGIWYHRLCRAVGAPSVAGVLSRSLGAAGHEVGAAAVEAIATLPDNVGLCSLRDLAWPMARLIDDGVRLNLLSLEALAAAEHLGAHLCLAAADENPSLLAAADDRNVTVRLVAG